MQRAYINSLLTGNGILQSFACAERRDGCGCNRNRLLGNRVDPLALLALLGFKRTESNQCDLLFRDKRFW